MLVTGCGAVLSTAIQISFFRMASENNRNGISLSLKYRGIFMGFDHADPHPRVQPVSLPSSGFRPKSKSPLQAATVLNGYILERTQRAIRSMGTSLISTAVV